MTNERKQLLQEKIDEAFKALNELSAVVTEEDMDWASSAYESDMSDSDEHLAMSLINIEDGLREMSHQFAM